MGNLRKHHIVELYIVGGFLRTLYFANYTNMSDNANEMLGSSKQLAIISGCQQIKNNFNLMQY